MFDLSDILFEKKDLIGSGRFGDVYVVFSQKYNQHFALKRLTKNGNTNDEMFENECQMLLKLYHPNIINIYEYFSTPNEYIIIMEYCQKSSLSNMVKLQGPLKKEKISSIFRQVVEAVKFAHENNIIHRDIKPENILFDEHERVKMADWGQSMLVSKEGIVDSYVGTLSYASPECLAKKPFNGFQSDMYSIGVCIYFATMGTTPWSEKAPSSRKEQILEGNYLIPPSVDEDIASVVRLLLSHDPELRPKPNDLLEMALFKIMPSLKLSRLCSHEAKKNATSTRESPNFKLIQTKVTPRRSSLHTIKYLTEKSKP